jgi:predicted dithiol-disulfide oxidoreductase (DUF899 family)
MSQRLSDESVAYAKSRAELLQAEIALKEQREHVAELRRSLPPGPEVTDYSLQELDADGGKPQLVHLSDLFTDPAKPLLLIHFMYGGAQENPCPMCSMWADGYDAVVRHLQQRANVALCAEAEIDKLVDWAQVRGWKNLRLVSSHGSSLKSDLEMQDEKGAQQPGVSVFTRDEGGPVRHFYTGEALMAPGHFRGMDLLSPVWNLFDLLPEGRGEWWPQLEYED